MESYGVAINSSGNVFMSGTTTGALGGSNKGYKDPWVAKYSSNGTLLWKKQLGTSDNDYSYGVATDSSGNVFISGTTLGSLGGPNKGYKDPWVAKYNPDGTLLWKKQLGTSSEDDSFGVATDRSGNVFISGFTYGALGGPNKGFADAWVDKYSPNGTLLWKKQLGTSESDISRGVATDHSGNIFISGITYGPLGGPHQGNRDAWVAKYNPDGTLLWTKQLGTSEGNESYGVATDGSGNVFISGLTSGDLGGPNKGSIDA